MTETRQGSPGVRQAILRIVAIRAHSCLFFEGGGTAQCGVAYAAPPDGCARELDMSIDSYRFLDFASRQVMKAWAARQRPEAIPFTPMTKPLAECRIALVSTAGIARNDDVPFDQDGERRDPWWGDPSFRVIPLGTTEPAVRLYHMHIDPRFGQADLDVVLPMRRLTELSGEGVVGAAPRHYSIMGYILEPTVLLAETAPAIAEHMRHDGVDAAALVPA
jgi:D-proline reductase (dithiol) PrdB